MADLTKRDPEIAKFLAAFKRANKDAGCGCYQCGTDLRNCMNTLVTSGFHERRNEALYQGVSSDVPAEK